MAVSNKVQKKLVHNSLIPEVSITNLLSELDLLRVRERIKASKTPHYEEENVHQHRRDKHI